METVSLILSLALPLFVILDSFGLVGILAPMIKHFDHKKQTQILRRETFFALIIMLFFFACGSVFLNALGVSQATIQLTGGIIFLFFALGLLFPTDSPISTSSSQEPFLVPIATPLIAGPSCLATIVLYSHNTKLPAYVILSAIFTAWLASAIILILTPKLSKILGETGIKVLEQIMGLVCLMIAVEMVLNGIESFTQ
ncbi:MAG: MarC family protein [Myxococcaceae bacterium]